MKQISRRSVLGAAAALAGSSFITKNASAQNNVVTIGVLTDMSGVFQDLEGPGAVVAAKMAIKDFGGTVLGRKIELLSADHQDKPDVGSAFARKWIDENHVNMIIGMDHSATALAVQKLASSKNTITINTGGGASELTEADCTKYGIHYVYDTHALAVGAAQAVVKQGGNTWFYINLDYAFGKALLKDETAAVNKLGGKIIGGVFQPLNTADFSSYLLQAQASKAKVVALGNAGNDFINSVKQAHEFGIVKHGQILVGMLVFITDVHSLGLEVAQGLQFATAFYWDRTNQSREWSQRFFKEHNAMPTMIQAGVYSGVMTYLNAVKAANSTDSDAVRQALGKITIDDMFVKNGHIEQNGLMRHDMYLAKVKTPQQSKGPWDLLEITATIPGAEAFIPLDQSSCPLLKA